MTNFILSALQVLSSLFPISLLIRRRGWEQRQTIKNMKENFERLTLRSQRQESEGWGVVLLQTLIALPIVYATAYMVLGWN